MIIYLCSCGSPPMTLTGSTVTWTSTPAIGSEPAASCDHEGVPAMSLASIRPQAVKPPSTV